MTWKDKGKLDAETRARMSKSAKKRPPRICSIYGFTREFVDEQRMAGKSWCSDCKSWYEGRGRRCKVCCSIRNKSTYYKEHAEERKHRRRALRVANPERYAKMDKIQNWRQYGINEAWYKAKLAEQGGGCALCKSIVPSTRLRKYFSVDHNHACCPHGSCCDKCRRGLLCDRCNLSLERAEAVPRWLENVVAYLSRYPLR